MKDQELKQLLARMLSDRLGYRDISVIGDDKPELALCWLADRDILKKHEHLHIRPVLDTELLAICRMVEEGLTNEEYSEYACALVEDKTSKRSSLSSSWQQRTEALAKVKGIL
jgi:hypothetical protein